MMIADYVAHKKLRATEEQSAPSLFSFEDLGDTYDAKQQREEAYRLKNHEIGWCPSNSLED